MKRVPFLLQNLLFPALMLFVLAGIYLYAGYQERAEQAASAAASASVSAVSEAMEVSAEGRRRAGLLVALADAGFAVAAGDTTETYTLYDGNLDGRCELILSAQGERVNGATIRFPLPSKPQTAKQPGLIEQALLDRHAAELEASLSMLGGAFDAVLSALDPYGEVPSTARLRWHDLLLDAANSGKSASDAGEALRFDLYFSGEGDARLLCAALQWK